MLSRVFTLQFGRMALLIITLCMLSQATPGMAAPPPQEDFPPADLRVEGDVAQSRLVIAGQRLFDQPGSHIGPLRLSPDGETVAVTVVPTGAETAHLAEIYLFNRRSGELLDRAPGHSAHWQDNRQLIYERDGARMIYDRSIGRALQDPHAETRPPAIPSQPRQEASVQYPQTIRVAHHPENGCRNVPAWQVDVIPFEDYVKRSVPAEMPVSWPMEALKAQAVAARTYAWHKIRVGPAYTPVAYGSVPYDVTDWANYQMMCNDTYARSNQAVEETVGQYLSAQSNPIAAPIIAMYSAQNSHPTLDNLNVDYLRAVPDRMGLGKARYGHGWGLSQWGARDRALVGHSYRQILGHYYTNVHLQNAFSPAQPLGGLIGLEANGFVPAGGFRWRTLGPATPLTGQLVINSANGFLRTADGEEQAIPTPLTLSGRSGVWRYPLVADSNVTVDASLWLGDSAQETITLHVDRTPPAAPSLSAPSTAEISTVTLNVTAGADEEIGLRNHWIWQGEALSSTVGAGIVIADASAEGGKVRLAQAGLHIAGSWYGPYTTALAHNATYRALFRLRIGGDAAHAANQMLPDRPIARLDVTDKGGELRLGLRELWATDFPAGETYVDLSVDFHLFQPAEGIEFRVHWHGETDLALDRVEVFRILKGGAQTVTWPLSIIGETATVMAVAFDAAGNVSAPTSRTVRVIDEHPPTIESIGWPHGWQTRLPITLTATVADPGSGLDFDSGGLWVNSQRIPVSFSARENPQAQQQMTAILSDLVEGEHILQFRIADQLGNLRQSAPHLLQLDMTPPLAAARALGENGSLLAAVDGWLPGPIKVEIWGEDRVSGVSALAYVLDAAPFVLYSEPFRVDGEGPHRVRYWAQDNAGNYSLSHFFDFSLDNTPPKVDLFVQAGNETSVTVGWHAEDNGSGVAFYEVEIEKPEDTWAPMTLTDPTALTAILHFEEQDQISIRVRATDRVGHTSAWKLLTVRPFAETIYLPLTQR